MHTKFLRIIAIFALMTLLLTGCVSVNGFELFADTIRGSGTAAQEERSVGDFDSVSLNGIGLLEITTGDSNSLVIQADDNILPHLTSEVRNGVLHIGTEPGTELRPDVPIRYSLTIDDPGLERLALNGSGDIVADELTQDQLRLELNGSGNIRIGQIAADGLTVQINGSGDIEVAGDAAEQVINMNGSGNYEGEALRSSQVKVGISGSGDVTVWAEENLDINISGSGSVQYYGSPDLTQRSSGSGEINSLGDR